MPRDRLPPYLRIAADLRDKIVNGEWLPGEQLPSQSQLMREYGVAGVTIQKALRVLLDEALIETRPRWGTFVAEPKPQA